MAPFFAYHWYQCFASKLQERLPNDQCWKLWHHLNVLHRKHAPQRGTTWIQQTKPCKLASTFSLVFAASCLEPRCIFATGQGCLWKCDKLSQHHVEEVCIIFHSRRFRVQQARHGIKLIHKVHRLWNMVAVETAEILQSNAHPPSKHKNKSHEWRFKALFVEGLIRLV